MSLDLDNWSMILCSFCPQCKPLLSNPTFIEPSVYVLTLRNSVSILGTTKDDTASLGSKDRPILYKNHDARYCLVCARPLVTISIQRVNGENAYFLQANMHNPVTKCNVFIAGSGNRLVISWEK